MYKVIVVFWLFSVAAFADDSINTSLDRFHRAAANADYKTYINLLADDAIYLGTDGGERWTKSTFSAYVKPYFDKNIGWHYVPIERNITMLEEQRLAFFDELLENKNYGRCRGTGVMINSQDGWKILQYNLTVVVPNNIAGEVVNTIKLYRDNQTPLPIPPTQATQEH